ncbi:MAG: YfbK domain-containing protein, partial [Planctomycetota bacterium]|nr:YfbK domain-containing protein [Planctomycetota bacterium]
GDANPESLAGMVIAMRDSGIAFDAAGIGADGLNDEVLEALTRKGDGRYYLLDSKESVEDGFAQQIAGALRPAAKNVKVQVEFNPQRVEMYKLLGFEKHRLKKEDFRNDKVDAAEMAAAEAGVAVYQVQVKPDGYGDLGSVAVRFRDLQSGRMVEERWPITFNANVPRIDLAPSSMKLAAVSSLFAMRLKGDERSETVDLRILREILSTLPPSKYEAPRVMGLLQMVEQARQMEGNSVEP